MTLSSTHPVCLLPCTTCAQYNAQIEHNHLWKVYCGSQCTGKLVCFDPLLLIEQINKFISHVIKRCRVQAGNGISVVYDKTNIKACVICLKQDPTHPNSIKVVTKLIGSSKPSIQFCRSNPLPTTELAEIKEEAEDEPMDQIVDYNAC